MSSVNNSCIPCVSVDRAVKSVSNMYTQVINNKYNLKQVPSVFLWGPPGVGKSQGVREIAKEVEKNTKKRVVITDVRLLLFNPIDLRGIPTSNTDKTLAVWLKPKIFDMDSSSEVINILFLDELSAAPQSVQAAAYQICLDHRVGEHELPYNCVVMAAGNRVTDKSVAFNMPKALANRLLHLEIESNFNSWEKWAVNKGINSKVIGFLKFKPDYLMQFKPAASDLAFPTPRSWEMVSNILNTVSPDITPVYELISGLIGTGAAIEFKTWESIYDKLPNVEDIFNGKVSNVPKDASAVYALVAGMATYAKEHLTELDKIENSLKYALKFAPDYTFILIKYYMEFGDEFKKELYKIPTFQKFIERRSHSLQ